MAENEVQISVQSAFSIIAALQERGTGHTALELGQCFGVIVVWTTCCFVVSKWHWSKVNVKIRLGLYLRSVRSGKFLLSHWARQSIASRQTCMKLCCFPLQQGLYADIFYCLPQVLDLYKVKKTNCNWMETAAFHRASKKALGDYGFLLI